MRLPALTALVALLLGPPARAEPRSFKGRGVHVFDAAVPCPLAGVGTRGERGCNRLVLDDQDSEARLDGAHLVIRNVARYPKKTLIGDLILSGRAQNGTPVAVHVKLWKRATTFSTELHAHVPTTHAGGKVALTGQEIPAFELSLDDGSGAKRTIGAKEIGKTLAAGRFVTRLLTVAATVGAPAGATDLTLGVGVDKANKKLLRARLVAPGQDLRQALRGSDWRLELTSLSSLLPQGDFKRDQFVHGLEGLPLLAPLGSRGLGKNQTVVVGVAGGKGFVELDGTAAPIPHAPDVVRSILETNSVGMILLAHLERR